MTQVRSIDALLASVPESLPPVMPEAKPEKVAPAPAPAAEPKPDAEPAPAAEPEADDYAESDKVKDEPVAAADDKPLDEYGNEVPKAKVYTEEEVQRMIRDRLARGNQNNQPSADQVEKAVADGFNPDPNSDEPWEVQLKRFVKETFKEMSEDEKRAQQQKKEQTLKADFEAKLFSGMSKYPDFTQVLSDKPVTDAMVMGTRSVENPAAFLYAAAKRFPQELTRISQLPDAYQQIAEMGKLHERMKRAPKTTGAPVAASQRDTSDISDTKPQKKNIDHLIHEHAKTVRRR